MSEHKDERYPLAGFFRNNGLDLPNWSSAAKPDSGEVESTRQPGRLQIPDSQNAPEAEQKAFRRMLRLFFHTGKGSGCQNLYPASLAAYRNQPQLRSHYPLWIGTVNDTWQVADLGNLLRTTMAQLFPAESEAGILKDNLPRLEQILRQKTDFAADTYEAQPVFAEGIQELLQTLDISGSEGETLRKNTDKLLRSLPATGQLIPWFSHAAFHLLSACLPHYRPPELTAILQRIRKAETGLRELLATEDAKSPEATSSDRLHESLDFADNFVNFDELSTVLSAESSEAMPTERLQRIQTLLDTLEKANDTLHTRRFALVADATLQPDQLGPEPELLPDSPTITEKPGRLCARAGQEANRQMEQAAQLFAALRLAELELANKYAPELHADLFAHFNWRMFSDEELRAAPTTVLLLDAASLHDTELHDFSDLLASGLPVRIFGIRTDQATAPDQDELPEREIAALAIAHRNVYVCQASVADPLYFLHAVQEGLKKNLPVFFHLYAPRVKADRNQLFLLAGAAVESREFPAFIYDRSRGIKWGSRFDIGNNPQAGSDWPQHPISITQNQTEASLDITLTVADFAALDDQNEAFFHPVPPEYEGPYLLSLDEYLRTEPSAQADCIPYLWMCDEHQILHKVAIAWPIVRRAYERREFWHFLQENAGIHSYHVEKAMLEARAEMEANFTAKAAELEASYQQELTRIREETRQNAMEQLAAALLDLDTETVVQETVTTPTSVRPEPEAPPEPEAKPEPKPEVEPEPEKPGEVSALILNEAYIDTPLCTSCNECIDINKKIFQYNGDKQAYVANPQGGPFADIVEAAENCPVGIIHPGAPQNPQEDGLEALVKRAEPFNE